MHARELIQSDKLCREKLVTGTTGAVTAGSREPGCRSATRLAAGERIKTKWSLVIKQYIDHLHFSQFRETAALTRNIRRDCPVVTPSVLKTRSSCRVAV